MVFKEPKKKWFKALKKTRAEFKNIDNLIESAQFRYNKENHLTEWIIGVSIALFLSVSINNISNIPIKWIADLGVWSYIITIIFIFISILLYSLVNYRQKIIVAWLYREKDKQEKRKKTIPKRH